MNAPKTLPHIAKARLDGLVYPAIRAVVAHEAEEHDLELAENSDERIVMETEYGHYSFEPNEGGCVVTVQSDRADNLFVLKDSLVESIAHFAPDAAKALAWSDAGTTGTLPPNFQLVTVQSVAPLGTDFLRVTIKAPDLTAFENAAIHFRIILPPRGLSTPEWPFVDDKGVTVWPKAEKALHRPVYTVRNADADTGLLTFDVYQHEGGRTTDWSQSVTPGAKVGLTGPGGGGVPDTKTITIYADETGFPAVARLLEGLAPDTTGRVILMSQNGKCCDYPMPMHANLVPEWHLGADIESLADLAIADRDTYANHMLWFATEKEDVLKLRTFCKGSGVDTKAHYIATYWSRT
jgi:NADPH-dependent ferric siderophore reductase